MLLALETSCDETSAAVVHRGSILSNIVSSQMDLHAAFGGVVPEIASRQHLRVVDAVIREACERASIQSSEIEAVAVTRGPGLPSALLVGVAAARGLSTRLGKPLIPVHHMEAHLYSPQLSPEPLVALVVSGGHTLLVHAPRFGEHRVMGQTVDDAAGEAFDKAAQLMGLGYPGGPVIERTAREGNPRAHDFPRPMLHSPDWNFSFSGLKTALRRTVTTLRAASPQLPDSGVADLCASFQTAVVEVLVEKTMRAAKHHRVAQVAVSGGVACNGFLRAEMEKRCRQEGIRLAVADRSLCTDNAGMIGMLAEKKMEAGFQPPAEWDIEPDWAMPSAS